jgi:hypothetical protein
MRRLMKQDLDLLALMPDTGPNGGERGPVCGPQGRRSSPFRPAAGAFGAKPLF